MRNPVEVLHELTSDKFDPILGSRIQKALQDRFIETPMDLSTSVRYDPDDAVLCFERGIRNGMTALGLDMDNESLEDTPMRFAKMMVGELTKGLCYDLFPKCTVTPAEGLQNLVVVRKLQVLSLCEHHLQTIDGFAHIAYIPGTKLLGLSKFARVTEFFCRRPQVQERLTAQIYTALSTVLETEDVAVVITAQHYCMKARGALQAHSDTTTDKMGGRFFSNPALREEFMHAIREG